MLSHILYMREPSGFSLSDQALYKVGPNWILFSEIDSMPDTQSMQGALIGAVREALVREFTGRLQLNSTLNTKLPFAMSPSIRRRAARAPSGLLLSPARASELLAHCFRGPEE